MNRRRFLCLSVATAVCTKVRAEAEAATVPLISFGVITDVQYADADPSGERHYRASLPKLRAAVAELAGGKLVCTLHLGDLIDHDFGSFAAIVPCFQALGHPVHNLLGNHDCAVADAEKCRVGATLGMPHDYYAFSVSGVRFVMLDSNDVSTYKYPPGSIQDREARAVLAPLTAAKANNAQSWNGGISAVQLAWLDKELAAADAAKEPVIVCGHHPLLPENGLQVWNSREILAVLERRSCVCAYLCGHNHGGAEVIGKGVPCITFKSLLHEPQVTAFSVLRLFKDRLVIEGHGREASRVIALRVAE